MVHRLTEQGGILGETGTIHPVQRHVNPVGTGLRGGVAALGAHARNRLVEKVGRYRLLAQPLHQNEIAAHVLRLANLVIPPVAAPGLLLVPVGQHAVERGLQFGAAIIFAFREGVCLGHLHHAVDMLQRRPVGTVGGFVVDIGETAIGGQLRQIAFGIHVNTAQRCRNYFRQDAVGKDIKHRLFFLAGNRTAAGQMPHRPRLEKGRGN